MLEQRKLTTILAADVAGYSRLTGADEEGTLRRLRALRAELIDPAIAANRGRIVKTTGDGLLVEFASVVDAARCALDVQRAMTRRNEDFVPEKRVDFRVGIHLGDVLVEDDGDLLGDGVNIAARLEGIAEPGGICLSEDAWRQVRDRLDAAFTDLGERELKNIARPVRVYAIAPSPLHSSSPSPPKGGEGRVRGAAPGQPTPSPRAVGAGPSLSATRRGEEGPPRLSIVVLPFANIGGDPEQDYFVDGVTESLTTDLSRISGSFVIGRNTAFTYKGKAGDLKQIGRELGVRYVLEGSVQRGGNRMRVNVQLIEAESGAHLWAERFDKPVADLFDMQDEIVARLANQLGTQLVAIEARRTAGVMNPDATVLYFRGRAALNSGVNPEIVRRARECFDQALVLDPTNADALAGLGHAHLLAVINMYYEGHFTEDRSTLVALTEDAAGKALTYAPNHAYAHYVIGRLCIQTDRIAEGIARCEHAVALDRNFAHAHAEIGMGKIYLGQPEDTEAYIVQALRISPRDVWIHVWYLLAGIAKLCLGHDQAGLNELQRAVESNPTNPTCHFYLAAALALIGDLERARTAMKRALVLDPTFNMQRRRQNLPSSNPVYRAQIERVFAAMLRAGAPED